MVFIRTSFSRVTYDEINVNILRSRGGDMYFYKDSTLALRLSSSYIYAQRNMLMTTGIKILDADVSTILDPDGSGNIAELAPLTGAIKISPSSHKVTGRPAAIASENQSGTLTEANGKWVAAAGDYLYLWLDTLIPQQALLAGVKIVSLEVVYDTGHNDDYITQVILGHYKNTQPNEANFSSDWSDTTDKGNGDTTADTAEYTPNVTLTVDRSYQLQIEAVVPQTSVTVFAINLEYELV